MVDTLPFKYLSYVFGLFATLRRPKLLARLSKQVFVWLYSIDLSESSKPLDQYASLADFFVRDLKPGLRPVGIAPVCPSDGELRSAHIISRGRAEQIKNVSYSISELLADQQLAQNYERGAILSFYLSPRDYHHVHAPISGEIKFINYIKGNLWPVNDWALRNVKGVFARNERLIIGIESDLGLVLVVMVGAANVGQMTLAFDAFNFQQVQGLNFRKNYTDGLRIETAARLGTFNLGSTVLLFFKPGKIDISRIVQKTRVKYGQPIGAV